MNLLRISLFCRPDVMFSSIDEWTSHIHARATGEESDPICSAGNSVGESVQACFGPWRVVTLTEAVELWEEGNPLDKRYYYKLPQVRGIDTRVP
jgi:hypothetical protein